MPKNVRIIPALLRSAAVSLLVALIFGGYLILIGIPKSTARNLYNQALLAADMGDLEKADQLLQDAYAAWPEDYIQEALN